MDLPFQPGMGPDEVAATAAPLLQMLAEAGHAIEEVQAGRDDTGEGVERKGDGSPVTAADRAADAILAPALRTGWPDLPVVSEESWRPGQAIPAVAWVVDPLDGTKEFIRQNGEYVVNVGLVRDGLPVFGAVHVPATGASFLGGAGIGAWRVAGGDWQRLDAPRFEHPPLRVVASRSHRGALEDRFLAHLDGAGVTSGAVPMGSAWKLILVAEGRADCYPRLGPTMWWDTLAPQAVVEGAGGRVLGKGLERFRYELQDGEPRNGHFLVAGPPGPSDKALLAAFAATAAL